jgi:hypothetical protein
MTKGWTDERRTRYSEIIKTIRPWERATGPRTPDGRAKVSQNAKKHGLRGGILRQAENLISLQRKVLKEISK